MKSRYDRLPEAMREHARAYVEDHHPVGGFLTAVLSNSLIDAFGLADEENRAAMADWALWLWNDIPSACWGSRAKVEAWLEEEPDDALTRTIRREATTLRQVGP